VYALVEAGHREAVDVYLRREEAQRELEEILADEPTGRACFTSCRSS
jgi:hypothetical protein